MPAAFADHLSSGTYIAVYAVEGVCATSTSAAQSVSILSRTFGCSQEVECRPRSLAVVVDRSVSSVQDLIDSTACKVRVVTALAAVPTGISSAQVCANSSCTVQLALQQTALAHARAPNCMAAECVCAAVLARRSATCWRASMCRIASLFGGCAGTVSMSVHQQHLFICCRAPRRQRRRCGACSSSWWSASPSATARYMLHHAEPPNVFFQQANPH